MKILFLSLPFLISFVLGYLLIELIFLKDKKPNILIHVFLAIGLGLGLSSSIVFLSFMFFNNLNKLFIISLHIVLFLGLVIANIFLPKKKIAPPRESPLPLSHNLLFGILAIGFIPIWFHAKYFPYGGWDAWSVWNFKAKFLLLAGENWKNLFDPLIWRSSPHYPLLLPLTNVWGWLFVENPIPIVPLITALLFTFITMGLLLAGLLVLTKNRFSILAPLVLLTLPFYGTLATSQYCEIVMAYYILAALFCLLKNLNENIKPYSLLAGIFIGLLSFTKPEGMVAGLVLLASSISLMVARTKDPAALLKEASLILLLVGTMIASLPTIIFKIACSPGNQTFINGFFSQAKPITLYRVKMVFAFFWVELKSEKWNGIWLFFLIAIFLSKFRGFRKNIKIIPVFLGSYLGIIILYYFMNTYFEIQWWLAVTLNRILFSLLPTFIFWIFYSLWQEKNS